MQVATGREPLATQAMQDSCDLPVFCLCYLFSSLLIFWSEICHAKAAPQQLPPKNLHVKWSAGKKICSRSFLWLPFQFAFFVMINHDKLWEIMCCRALNVPILSHELYPINIPWNRGSYPHRQHRLHCRGGKTHASIIKGFLNGGPKQGWQKKNVGDLQGIIGVEPMTNWGKIQQLVSNQWIILRENPPENFLGGSGADVP